MRASSDLCAHSLGLSVRFFPFPVTTPNTSAHQSGGRRLHRCRKVKAVALRAFLQHGRDGGVQRKAVSRLRRPGGQSAVAGHAHVIKAGPGRVVPARVGDSVGLMQKIHHAAECSWIVERHEHGRAPAVGGIGTAMTHQSGGERLDQQAQPEAFVPGRQSLTPRQTLGLLARLSARSASAFRSFSPSSRLLVQ